MGNFVLWSEIGSCGTRFALAKRLVMLLFFILSLSRSANAITIFTSPTPPAITQSTDTPETAAAFDDERKLRLNTYEITGANQNTAENCGMQYRGCFSGCDLPGRCPSPATAAEKGWDCRTQCVDTCTRDLAACIP